jgi:hypothetical protein
MSTYIRYTAGIAAGGGGTSNGVNAVGVFDAQPASARGATIVTNSIFFQSADATHPGMVNNAAQTMSGAKTFSTSVLSPIFSSTTANPAVAGVIRLANTDVFAFRNGTNAADLTLSISANVFTFNANIAASNLSGTNTGDVTLTAVGAVPNANGASLSGQVLTLQPADATHPGLISLGSQTIGSGTKTFDNIIDSGLSVSQAVVTDGSKQLASLAYTSANTPTTLVERDGAGNFSAGTITATISGTSTNATNVSTTQVSTNASFFPLFVASSTNGNQAPDLGTGLTFNPSTNTMSTTTFVGALTGTASGNLTLASPANHGVLISGSANATTALAAAAAGTVLTGQGTSADPSFSATPTLGVTGTTLGTLALAGNTTGAITIKPQAAAGTYNFNLPITAGSAGNVLTSQAGGSTAMTWTGAVSAATASAIALRDANANTQANNFIDNLTTTATAGTTTTLTVGSAYFQQFTGSTTQQVNLPDTSTLVVGQAFQIMNRSSGVVTVKTTSGTNLVQAMAASSQLVVTCVSIASNAAASWDAAYSSAVATGTVTSVAVATPNSLSVSGSPVTTSGTITLANRAINAQTADYTLTATDSTVTFDASGASRTATLPTAVGASGTVYVIKKIDSSTTNTVTLATTSAQTIDGIASGTLKLATQYESITVESDGANWLILDHKL